MTRVVFETATLADSIRKAASIAPGRAGDSFDKAAGIMIEVYPEQELVILRATDLLLWYMEWVGVLEVHGEPVRWRVPSKVFEAIISAFPLGSGKTVALEADGSSLKIESSRTRAKLRLIDPKSYPDWFAFPAEELKLVPEIGARIAQVEWAAAKDVPSLGIRFTGTQIVATDKYRLAAVPLELEGVGEGITVPPSILSTILKRVGETRVGVTDTHLLLMPDDRTQVKIIRVGEHYPPIQKAMRRDHPNSVKFRKSHVIDAVNRATKIGSDRFPVLRLIIGKEEFATFMAEEELGHIGDVVELSGQAQHDRIEIRVHPQNFTEALTNAPSEEVIFYYDIQKPKTVLLRIDGGSGYDAWLAPRGDVPKSEVSQ